MVGEKRIEGAVGKAAVAKNRNAAIFFLSYYSANGLEYFVEAGKGVGKGFAVEIVFVIVKTDRFSFGRGWDHSAAHYNDAVQGGVGKLDSLGEEPAQNAESQNRSVGVALAEGLEEILPCLGGHRLFLDDQLEVFQKGGDGGLCAV